MIFSFIGVDSTTLEMSLSTAWRDRRAVTEEIAGDEIAAFFDQVQESGDRILVQFDEKEVEEDIDGKLVKRIRLAVVFSSPWLQLEQLICAIPIDSKSGIILLQRLPALYNPFSPGEAVAEAVYATLLQYSMEEKVLGFLADTTASNFGQWRNTS